MNNPSSFLIPNKPEAEVAWEVPEKESLRRRRKPAKAEAKARQEVQPNILQEAVQKEDDCFAVQEEQEEQFQDYPGMEVVEVPAKDNMSEAGSEVFNPDEKADEGEHDAEFLSVFQVESHSTWVPTINSQEVEKE